MQIKHWYLIPLCLLIYSCSSWVIDVDYDDTLTFSGLKRYAWVPDTPVKSGNPAIDSNTLLQDRIRQDIVTWLETHGYSYNPTNPDFLIAYQIIVENKTKMTVMNDYYDYPLRWGYRYPLRTVNTPRQTVYEYRQGTLIIDMVNPATRKLMWRGSATDEVKQSSSIEQRNQRVREAVDEILQRFPPDRE